MEANKRIFRGLLVATLLLTGLATRAWSQTPPASAPAPASTAPAPAAKSKLVTNVWVDMDIRQVVQDVASETDTVILCDQTVQGIVSMSVKDMPLTDCLERICAAGGYSYTQVKDYFLIGKAEPGSALFQRLSEPQRVKLTYVTADQVRMLLHPSLMPYMTFDKVGGTVIVTAPQPLRSKILNSLQQLDQPNPQVAIDAVVFELTEDGSKQLALDWQFKVGQVMMGSENLMQTLTYNAGTDMATYVQATLRAIVEARKGQVLANPRVLVMNNTEAEIFVGQEKYFTLLSGQASNPYYTLQSIKAGVTLKVSPAIGQDGQITLGLEPEVSDVVADDSVMGNSASLADGSSAPFPVVTRRRAKTVVGTRDGETIMIGGLLRDQHRQIIDKVPGIGDIPLLGAFFRKVSDTVERQEVVLLITVHLVDSKHAGTDQLTSRLLQRYVTPLDGINQLTALPPPAAAVPATTKGGVK
jgi:type II secretory pathway component GspD/PulD (secretin)